MEVVTISCICHSLKVSAAFSAVCELHVVSSCVPLLTLEFKEVTTLLFPCLAELPFTFPLVNQVILYLLMYLDFFFLHDTLCNRVFFGTVATS